MEIESNATISLNLSDNVCRVCLATNQSNQCIFEITQDRVERTISFSEKFRLCSGVQIWESDGLPTMICMGCVSRINDAHELRKQCQDSDKQLRILYGKIESTYEDDYLKTMKDQHSQTDCIPISDAIKVETSTCLSANCNVHARNNCNGLEKECKGILHNCNVEYVDDQMSRNAEEIKVDCSANKQDVYEKSTHTDYAKVMSGRGAYRMRRTTMFKRVTSMENLKNHKERQRQYIKKNVNMKWDDEPPCVKKARSQGSYFCLKCTRRYSSKRSLERHVSTHMDEKFTCEECDKQFFQLDKFTEHSKSHMIKEQSKPVLCKICDKHFRKTDTMVRHLNIHKKTNPKEVLSILKEIRDKRRSGNVAQSDMELSDAVSGNSKCEMGTEFITDEDILLGFQRKDISISKERESDFKSSHLKSSSEKPNLTNVNSHNYCKYCGKHYANEKALQRHLQNHTEKKYACSVCNMKFFREDRLNSHKNRYGHNEESALIDIEKPSDDKSAIKLINSWIREELDSDNEEKGFPCKICGKSYDTKKSLLKHQVGTHNTQKDICSTCGTMCICEEKGKGEQKSNYRLKLYPCNECNKSFEKEAKLQKHMRIHERAKEQQDVNFKRFLCHICSKTFRQNTGLMFHMRTHTGYKPHVCKYCGRGFTSNSNCINHERTHTGDRPFVCHFCSAAFAKSCTLKAHITTHTGEANYHCKTCGKSFRRLKYLKEHRFTHTGEKPYVCKICGTAYSHSGSLFVHEKKCKAQYNSYQSNPTQDIQNYCESDISSPSVTPIITVLPQISNATVMGTQNNKSYIDNLQRINPQEISNMNNVSDPNVHQNSDISDVSLAVKSFALIGQMF